jgi:Pectate lyase superfamily protein
MPISRSFLMWLFLSCALLRECIAQTPPPPAIASTGWINVRDYGAKGDGRTDDRVAILNAINAAIRGQGTNVVYFPRGSGYVIASAVKLPYTGNKWIELYFDDNLVLGGSVEVGSHYYFHGHSGGQTSSFDTSQTTTIGVGSRVSPAAIHIVRKTNIRLENLSLKYVGGGADGIRIDADPDGSGQSAMITLRNVHVVMASDNTTGIPLHIKGGFGYYVEGGGYSSRAEGEAPSIMIEDDIASCNNTGIIRFRDVFLSNHGMKLRANCGGLGNMTLEGLLYESGSDALVTVEEQWPGFLYGIRMKDCNIADSNVPAMENHSPRIYGVSLDNCATSGGVLTTGQPIDGLDVWSPVTIKGQPPRVAQTKGYIIRTPFVVISTMPALGTASSPTTTSAPASGESPAGDLPAFPEMHLKPSRESLGPRVHPDR